MITSLLIGAAITLLVTLATNIVLKTYRVHKAHKRFKKESLGLPTIPINWSPGGNIHDFVYNPSLVAKLEPLHRRLGKTFGFMFGEQASVSTIDLTLIKILNVDESSKHINRASAGVPLKEIRHDSIKFVKDEQWRRIRKPLAQSLTKRTVLSKNVADEIDLVIRHLTECLDNLLGGAPDSTKCVNLNVDDLLLRYSIDLTFTCFYRQRDIINYDLSVEDYHVSLIENAMNDQMHPVIPASLSVPLLTPIIEFHVRRFHPLGELNKTMTRFIKQQTALSAEARETAIKAKKKDPTFNDSTITLKDGQIYKRNLVDTFIDSFLDGKISYTEYMHTSFFLILASVKTKTDSLSRLLYYLASDVEIQEKLRAAILKDGHEAEYLGWCINEALRLDPPAPLGSSRIAERDIEIEGGVVPKGTFVLTPAHTIHRLPEYWGKDANQFKPERWSQAHTFHPAQYIPFGGGTRACPGKEFALQDMRKVMQALLTRYKFERCAKTSDTDLFCSPLMIYIIREMPIYLKISKL